MIILFVGHDAKFKNAYARKWRVYEWDICKQMVGALSVILHNMGIEHMVHDSPPGTDRLAGLREDIKFAKAYPGAELCIDFHLNDNLNTNAHGCEALVHPKDLRAVAAGQCILAELEEYFMSRGIKRDPEFLFLNIGQQPEIILETCFINNDGDMAELIGKMDQVCQAIANGIQHYLKLLGEGTV